MIVMGLDEMRERGLKNPHGTVIIEKTSPPINTVSFITIIIIIIINGIDG